jgi:hypothetical protein
MKRWCLLLLLFVASCKPPPLIMGSPYQRYDHNRTQPVSLPSQGDTMVLKRTYIPFGSDEFPKLEQGAPAPDGLPAANLVPVFTGVPLPLSTSEVADGKNDFDDLVDYLGSGPEADHGVQPPAMTGEFTGKTKEKYRQILELLVSANDEAKVNAWIEKNSIPKKQIASEWVDSRYSADSFHNRLAIQFEDFWFLLYRLDGHESFSRLVVVPTPIKKNNRADKRP